MSKRVIERLEAKILQLQEEITKLKTKTENLEDVQADVQVRVENLEEDFRFNNLEKEVQEAERRRSAAK
jgi:TolA-binding protein